MLFRREPISRRELLVQSIQTAAGLAAAGALHVGSRAADISSGKRPAKMRLGLTTVEWGSDWDIPTLIINCTKARLSGVELRMSENHAHGVELDIGTDRRREVRKRFEDGPVTLVGLASGELFDWPDAGKVNVAIERTKGYLRLSHDLGASGVRVFPNDFHEGIPREQTIAQIAKALNIVGAYAADYGQQVRFECHGSAGDLASIRAVMDHVTEPSVRVKLNSLPRDATGQGFEHNFNLVKDFLGDTLHALHEHGFEDDWFPHQQQISLLTELGWHGWVLLEIEMKKPADRIQVLRKQGEIFERMVAKS